MMKKRAWVIAAIAVIAGAASWGVGLSPAAAEASTRQTVPFTFTSVATGQPVTCTVEAYAAVFGGTDDARREAFGSLKGYGSDPSCGEGTATLVATYRNSSGVTVRSGAGGDRAAYWTADDVGPGAPNLSVEHEFTFSDCSSNCTVTATTAPK